MKKFYAISLCLYLIIILGAINIDVLKARAKSDLIIDILKNTESDVIQYGIRISFLAENQSEEECGRILDNLKFVEYKNIDIVNEKDLYTIEFMTEDISGYIQYVKVDEGGSITLELIGNKPELGLNVLRNRAEKAVGNKRKQQRYFQYVKASTKLSDITYAKDAIVDLLRKRNAANIDEIDLEKGFSITAYTGHYEQMKSGNKWIDLNCAVFSYESGNYVIIGTPIITTSY